MATFRVQKNHDYTVMSNYHLKDKNISLKAKGLLSQILSLPESWTYTLRGLSSINKESVDAIRTAVQELEKHGYITRKKVRGSNGKMSGIEYTIYEQPQSQSEPSPCLDNPITAELDVIESETEEPWLENPTPDNPIMENPMPEVPTSEEPTLLNTKDISNTKILNTQESTIQSINPHTRDSPADTMDGITDADDCRNKIKSNIEYDILLPQWGDERMDEVVELLLETILSSREYIRIAGDDYPPDVVKSRLMKINAAHVEYVFDCMNRTTSKIRNIKSYLLTALFNAPATMDSFYRAAARHDLYGNG